ncbi:hypothetical protein HHK36_025816 [Tetracentron sinense]|uniref:CUE domain-containing protein n=1 Tax=Tetracentron sinense TaxID=13715 RepID=A0A834YLY2_TETSI|nr:hypothetical protein HHK36_025816 [Tetracentron sinense]
MSAIVCGKRSFFEDLQTPPVSKRIRCSSTSPIRFSPPRPATAAPSPLSAHLIDHLRAIFPDMDDQQLGRALEECGNDLDSTIKSLNELRLGSVEGNLGSAVEKSDTAGMVSTDGDVASSEEPSVPNIPHMDGAEWVDLFVGEMKSASNMDDARARASKVLAVLEESISERVVAEGAQSFHKENTLLKEQVELLTRENNILKRAVAIQHERQKEYDDRSQELQHLKQLVSQYQEQLRTLELNNYTLMMHLRQAQQGSSISGRFNPDVF